ncbi:MULTISPECIES: LysR family transcriptional regulator [Actinoalloteichus]|uniref:Transcriptional regulator n=1 Tax=Actinoalloteichus fjordicus TaxID=1612552 RepID=A0AAC9LFV8_9PSEU|nr:MULTISPECIES: LysR family transcriptional regulator [Actinoalloteichus]APU16119.1 transcriptional regulator [Actinoalloteichus fjordicus]APU22182.1 transcriptional regulator [Actinoalloteichus sp. GBA129-24]
MRAVPDVSLTQLRYFVRAAERGSMTRAAQDLIVAQSAVSTAVAALERELGVQLFIRQHAKGLILTRAGTLMLRHSRLLLGGLAEAFEEVSGEAAAVAGPLAVACFSTLSPFYLPSLLSDLSDAYPRLDVSVHEIVADKVEESLRSGAVEIAFTYDLALGDDVAKEVLTTIAPYVALPIDHPLATGASVALADLAEEPMVLLDLPHSRDYFLSMFSSLGLSPTIRYRSQSFETVRALVARRHGFALLNQRPQSDLSYDGERVLCVPVADDVPALHIVLASLGSLRQTRRAAAFAERARAVVAALADRDGTTR